MHFKIDEQMDQYMKVNNGYNAVVVNGLTENVQFETQHQENNNQVTITPSTKNGEYVLLQAVADRMLAVFNAKNNLLTALNGRCTWAEEQTLVSCLNYPEITPIVIVSVL